MVFANDACTLDAGKSIVEDAAVCPAGMVFRNNTCTLIAGKSIVEDAAVCPAGMVFRNNTCTLIAGKSIVEDAAVCPYGMVFQNDTCTLIAGNSIVNDAAVCPAEMVLANGACTSDTNTIDMMQFPTEAEWIAAMQPSVTDTLVERAQKCALSECPAEFCAMQPPKCGLFTISSSLPDVSTKLSDDERKHFDTQCAATISACDTTKFEDNGRTISCREMSMCHPSDSFLQAHKSEACDMYRNFNEPPPVMSDGSSLCS